MIDKNNSFSLNDFRNFLLVHHPFLLFLKVIRIGFCWNIYFCKINVENPGGGLGGVLKNGEIYVTSINEKPDHDHILS